MPTPTRIETLVERLLLHLARSNHLALLSAIGLMTGLASGAVIIAFRLLVESSQGWLLPGDSVENYGGLEPWQRLALPIIGGLLIGLLFNRLSSGSPVLGVPRVMERLAYHQGYLRAREFLLQFVGAALAIISGHSVGREGPNIFLGAATGSMLGQRFHLPDNSIRTMAGCGVAAGIAASFNTPLAGVIFALEVVMLEYTIASFTPIILAAVGSSALSIAMFGNTPAFHVPPVALTSFSETPLVLLLGLVCGAIAALFIELSQQIATRSRKMPFWQKATLAGLVTGLCGLLFPGVMGIGYDTVGSTLLGEPGAQLLLGLLLFKVVASAACIGLGIPGGTIGPMLFIGACAGGLVGLLGTQLLPEGLSGVGIYALLGMGALMSASLQAPLSALTAVVELTQNPAIVMPAMFVIVIADLVASELFGKESMFISVLKANGLDYQTSPVMQSLRSTGVAALMSEDFRRLERVSTPSEIEALLAQKPEWIIVGHEADEPQRRYLLPTMDLLRYMQESSTDPEDAVDLFEIPARRQQLQAIHLQATLQTAWEMMENDGVDALYVERMTAPGIHRIYGILTRDQVESAYRR